MIRLESAWGVSTGTKSNNGVSSKSYNIIQVHQTRDFLLPSELQDTPMHFFRHEFAWLFRWDATVHSGGIPELA